MSLLKCSSSTGRRQTLEHFNSYYPPERLRCKLEVAIVRSNRMPEPYSNDLRRKFFKVYASGEVSLKELAQRFGVSESWAKKLSARRSKTGQIEIRSWRHGPKGRVTTAIQEWMQEQMRRQPDLTLEELQQQLKREHRLQLSVTWIWILLRRWGLRHKKNRSARKNKNGARISGTGRRGGST